jgi:hypothetical protein
MLVHVYVCGRQWGVGPDRTSRSRTAEITISANFRSFCVPFIFVSWLQAISTRTRIKSPEELFQKLSDKAYGPLDREKQKRCSVVFATEHKLPALYNGSKRGPSCLFYS